MCYLPLDPSATPPAPGPYLHWEETKCLLCGGSRSRTLLEAPDTQAGTGYWFPVVQCDDCGLCYTNPRPRQLSLVQFYPDDYRPHQVKSPGSRGLLKRLLSWFPWRRAPIPWHGHGRLLDFGCGGGSFLQEMRARGWKVTGIDLAADTVHRLRETTGLEVFDGTLPHPELFPATFDVVTMWHSLEHVARPKEVLSEAHRLLVPGGKLVVAVPNIDSLAFRMFGQMWFGLDLPRHLTHFAPWTLHVMLERTGFKVDRIRMVRHSAWLRHSARLACMTGRATSIHRWLRGKPLSRLAAWYSCLTGQSDCMLATATAA